MDASGDSSSDALTMAQLEGFELEEEEHGALELVQLAKVLDSQGHIEEAEDLFQSALDRFGRQGGTLQRGSIASDVQGDRVMVSSLFNFSTCTHAHSSLLFFSFFFFFFFFFFRFGVSRLLDIKDQAPNRAPSLNPTVCHLLCFTTQSYFCHHSPCLLYIVAGVATSFFLSVLTVVLIFSL